MERDGLIKVFGGAINNLKSGKEGKNMLGEKLLRMVLVMLFVVVLGMGCDSGGKNPAGPSGLPAEATTSEASPASTPLPPTGLIPDIEVRNATNLINGVLYFGDVVVGERHQSFVDITNVGKGNLLVEDVRVSTAGTFRISSVCPSITRSCSHSFTYPYRLSPGEYLTVFIEFAPPTAGSYCSVRDYLTIQSNDPDERTVRIGLCGRGI